MRVRGYAAGTPCLAVLTGAGQLAIEFYAGLFGWQLDGTLFRLWGEAVAGYGPHLPAPRPAWLACMSTSDIEVTVTTVRAAGGRVLAGPLDEPAGGRLAVCADAAGAVFGCWQRVSLAGAQLTLEPGAVCWTDLAVADPGAAESFYGKVFDWSTRPGQFDAGPRFVDWVVGDRVVAGLVTAPRQAAGFWLTTFQVENQQRALARITELGGAQLRPARDTGAGSFALVRDPAGVAFGVLEMSPELMTE